MNAWDGAGADAIARDRFDQLPPAGPEELGPSLFSGFGRAMATVPFAVMGRAALAASETATPWLRDQAQAYGGELGKSVDDWLADEQLKTRREVLGMMPKPETTGLASQIAFGLGTMLPEFYLAGRAGGPAGAFGYETLVEGTLRKVQLEAAGVDPATAAQLGFGEGAVTGAFAFVPPAFGQGAKSLLARIGYQAAGQGAINAGLGMASRAASADYLREHGYAALAEQYRPFVASQVALDFALGAGLGMLNVRGRPALPMDRALPTADALLHLNAAGHADLDVAPGLPVDIRAANAHADALAAETERLISGRPPIDAAEIVDGARFVARPPEIIKREQQALDEANAVLAELAQQAERAHLIEWDLPAPERLALNLEPIRGEIGWAEYGGRIIRAARETAQDRRDQLLYGPGGGEGEVVGRTKWIPKSEFWPDRPDKSLSEKAAHVALDKAARGERLTPRERRFVAYARETLAGRAELDMRADAEAKAEAQAEREAIQSEGELTDADLAASGFNELTPEERLAVEHNLDYAAYAHELERATEQLRAIPREAFSQGSRPPVAGEPAARVQGAPEGARPGGGAQPAEAGLALNTYDSAELRQREQEAIAAATRDTEARRASEQKAIADAQLSAFSLTGSDRAADANPRQADLTDYPGTPEHPVDRDVAIAAADARIAEAEKADAAVGQAVACSRVEGNT